MAIKKSPPHYFFVILRTLVRRIPRLLAIIDHQLHCVGFFGLRPQNDNKKTLGITVPFCHPER